MITYTQGFTKDSFHHGLTSEPSQFWEGIIHIKLKGGLE